METYLVIDSDTNRVLGEYQTLDDAREAADFWENKSCTISLVIAQSISR